MTNPGTALLLVFLILEIKHFVCDYPLQRPYQLLNKGTYGHPGGMVHAGIHAVGTLFAFLAITPTIAVGLLIIAGEFIVHYHIDWAKQKYLERSGASAADESFWLALGFDQFLHHLTYVAIAAVLWMTMAA